MGKLVTLTPIFLSVYFMWISLRKRLVSTLYYNFFAVNMIFSAVQTLGYNKICVGFNHRGGARGPLSAPGLKQVCEIHPHHLRVKLTLRTIIYVEDVVSILKLTLSYLPVHPTLAQPPITLTLIPKIFPYYLGEYYYCCLYCTPSNHPQATQVSLHSPCQFCNVGNKASE